MLPLVGAGFMVPLAATNTIVQTIVEEHLRGRVMAFYTMAFLGTAPIGSLLAGVLADRIGEPATIVVGGVACLRGRGLVREPAATAPRADSAHLRRAGHHRSPCRRPGRRSAVRRPDAAPKS